MADFIFDGLNKILEKYEKAGRSLPEIMANSITNSHEKIMTVAKSRTPVLTGALRDSGEVRAAEIEGDTIKSVGAFGGGNITYALEVHENLNAHHNIGQAKFYESAAEDGKEDAINQLNIDVFKEME